MKNHAPINPSSFFLKTLLPLALGACLLPSCANSSGEAVALDFHSEVLAATSLLPSGGGYDVSDETKNLLVGSSRATSSGLSFNLAEARPSFCSSATYLVFLLATEQTIEPKGAFARTLTVSPNQQDGHGIFGRWNANGPGCAKLVADLDCGINFDSWDKAKRGDFLKIWWTADIGKKERGHHVVYLSHDADSVTFWSSNQPNGYGRKTVPRSQCRRVLFTRITQPGNIARATSLPEVDPWLAAMLTRDFTWAEVVQRCKVR